MARIGILTCSNATQELGCSSVSCLADLRKRRGAFSVYPENEDIVLVGIINCPGCPTVIGPDKLLQRIRALTEFRVDAIHFSFCIKALCPFKEKYSRALKEAFPGIRIITGTHEEHITEDEYRRRVKKLLCQDRKTMVDLILGRD
jgi:predicted metal-binding protein